MEGKGDCDHDDDLCAEGLQCLPGRCALGVPKSASCCVPGKTESQVARFEIMYIVSYPLRLKLLFSSSNYRYST